jgi:hypothetical protein
MKYWARAPIGMFCGGRCGGRITAGSPVMVIALATVPGERFRCEQCAGEPVDWGKVERRATIVPYAEPAGMTPVRGLARRLFDAKARAANDSGE